MEKLLDIARLISTVALLAIAVELLILIQSISEVQRTSRKIDSFISSDLQPKLTWINDNLTTIRVATVYRVGR